VNYHRFADDIVVTVSGHHSKQDWAKRALQRLREQIEPLGVNLSMEKTKVVNTLNGGTFRFLGFDFRRILNREKNRHYILLTTKKARLSIKAKIREIVKSWGATPGGKPSLAKRGGVFVKVSISITRNNNPFDEDYWASCLRENLTSSSYGEGLEPGRESSQEPRQSFTRQTFFGWWKRHLKVYDLISRSHNMD